MSALLTNRRDEMLDLLETEYMSAKTTAQRYAIACTAHALTLGTPIASGQWRDRVGFQASAVQQLLNQRPSTEKLRLVQDTLEECRTSLRLLQPDLGQMVFKDDAGKSIYGHMYMLDEGMTAALDAVRDAMRYLGGDDVEQE